MSNKSYPAKVFIAVSLAKSEIAVQMRSQNVSVNDFRSQTLLPKFSIQSGRYSRLASPT